MSYLTAKKFSFESTALPPDSFAVVEFQGSEALSRPYEFEIMLVTERSDIDLDSVLQKPASFTFHRETGGDVKWNGMIAQFEQLHNFNIYTFYRAHLVPRLWWLQLTHHNQIFLDKTVREILEAGLKNENFLGGKLSLTAAVLLSVAVCADLNVSFGGGFSFKYPFFYEEGALSTKGSKQKFEKSVIKIAKDNFCMNGGMLLIDQAESPPPRGPK